MAKDMDNGPVNNQLGNDTETMNQAEQETKRQLPMSQFEKRLRGWGRQALILLLSVLIVGGVIFTVVSTLEKKYLAPVDANADYFIEVTIPRGASVSKIANILEEQGIIRSKMTFKLSVDLMEMNSKLRSGTYYLSPNMTTENILDILSSGASAEAVVRVTVVEGRTVEEIAQQMVDEGILSNAKEFLELCNNVEEFKGYSFIDEQTEEVRANKKYALEGYLFPDTYDFYSDASAKEIIVKMLNKFNQVYNGEIMQKAQELNMTTDQVIAMASLVEKEAKEKDFNKVSAVFHNRLGVSMPLQSCVTVQYALGIKNLVLTDEQMAVDSPYNTYKNKGLPAGPVCNPGLKAIKAAIEPDEELTQEKYYYFCLTDPATGELEFSRNLEEHNAAKAKWQALWLEYDHKNAQ